MTEQRERRAAPRRVLARPGSRDLPPLLGLDGLRGVAVLAVVAYHLDLVWAGGGFLGVEVFFTLSGFLVTQLLGGELRRRGRIGVAAFARARARRLVPALVACVLGTVLAYRVLRPDETPALWADALASLAWVQNWHLVLAGVPYGAAFDRPSPLLHLWSLGVEAQLYVVLPLIVAGTLGLLRRRGLACLLLVLAVASAVAAALQYDPESTGLAYYATDARASGFLVGAALGVLWRPESWSRARHWAVARTIDLVGGLALVGLLATFVTTSEFDDGLYREGGFLRTGACTALVLLAATRRGGPVHVLLSGRVLVWAGRRSYGIYLYHWPIFVLSAPVAVPMTWVLDVARVGLTLAVAEVSYRWLELPVRRRAVHRASVRFRLPAGAVRGAGVATVAAVVASVIVVTWPGVPATEPVRAVTGALSWTRAEAAPAAAEPIDAGTAGARPAAEPADATSVAEPGPAGAGPPGTPAGTDAAGPAPAGQAITPPPLVVGDSVVLGSADALVAALGPATTVDGKVGRQFSTAPAIVRAWVAGHDGPVVVHLGSNGTVEPDDLDAVLAATGTRTVVLVGVSVPRRWQDGNNALLRGAAERNAPRVRYADWPRVVAGTPGLLGPDRVHPLPRGRALLAAEIRAALTR